MSRMALVLLGFCVVLSVALVMADEEPQYLGVAGCKTCHKSKKKGDQYGIWSKGPHAKTYTELGEEKGKEVAKKAGVEGDPQKEEKCLKCHVTAYGVAKERLSSKFKIEEGVTCEACHGPGSGYKKPHYKEGKEEDAKKAGFIAKPDEKSCKKCHNEESPTYKEFKFDEKFKKIAHPVPEK